MPPKTIALILKDPELNQRMEDEILSPAGFNITFFNKSQATNLFGNVKDIDLVILEVLELGNEETSWVKTFVDLNPWIPVLLLSTSFTHSKQIEAFRLGAADCLALPVQNEEVLEAVHRALMRWSRFINVERPVLQNGKEDRGVFDGHVKGESDQAEFGSILASSVDGIIILDEENRFTFINSAAQQIFNLSERDFTGKPLKSAISHSNFIDMIENISEENSHREEISLQNGKVYNTHLARKPGSGTVIIMQDITQLKDLDRIKSEFVAMVSHDLRSPLTAILGYTELIDRVGPINEQQQEFIRRIQFSTHNITNLINDLLDLGRIEAGFDTQKEIVSMSTIARYAVEGLRSRIEEKQQELHLELEDHLPSIFGNPIRLRQMAGNLIGNAVKYTPNGGRIWVRVMGGDEMLIFQVQDTGIGIPSQDQPHIFNKFYRGTNFPVETQGTGLGLAIVKSIAENHQGRVWLESNSGDGTTFTVVLPVIEQS